MVRNWEIIRSVLLRLEDGKTARLVVQANQIEGFAHQEVAYNMALMKDAGLIDGLIRYSSEGDGAIALAVAHGMTSKGHDFLDSIRNEGIWFDVKKRFREKGIEMTVDLVMKVSAGLAAAALG